MKEAESVYRSENLHEMLNNRKMMPFDVAHQGERGEDGRKPGMNCSNSFIEMFERNQSLFELLMGGWPMVNRVRSNRQEPE